MTTSKPLRSSHSTRMSELCTDLTGTTQVAARWCIFGPAAPLNSTQQHFFALRCIDIGPFIDTTNQLWAATFLRRSPTTKFSTSMLIWNDSEQGEGVWRVVEWIYSCLWSVYVVMEEQYMRDCGRYVVSPYIGRDHYDYWGTKINGKDYYKC